MVELGRQTKKCRNMFPVHVHRNVFPTLYSGVGTIVSVAALAATHFSLILIFMALSLKFIAQQSP